VGARAGAEHQSPCGRSTGSLGIVQKHFYATSRDLQEICAEVSRTLAVRYDRAGVFATADLHPIENPSGTDLAATGSADSYLISLVDAGPQIRRIETTSGVRFAVDELINPASATLQLGFKPSASVLTPGTVGCTAASGSGPKIVRCFEKALVARFKRVRAYWVGPEAVAMLNSGARLTPSAQSPREYDLVAEHDA
jgi:hypothetical protein